MRLKNVEGVSQDEMLRELDRGGRFVMFHWTLSLVIVSFKMPSDVYFVREGGSTGGMAFPYVLLTLLFGWWGFPWGPIYSISCLVGNLRGGTDVTFAVLEAIPALAERSTPRAADA